MTTDTGSPRAKNLNLLKNPLTYQIMAHETVGGEDYQLVLGKHSGRAGFRAQMERLGVKFASDDALGEAFRRFKKLTDHKAHLDDRDLLSTVKKEDESHV